ncbi:putative DNA polymerase [Golovinomyces cichoracearum]|uniref:Probable DNA polymerase n=1 Tax=Golovinomyces cichoracearum TaxID=62708 RepID=A0A420IYH1_9PEZI|nr:putative DNA polymerase [Golovinomyces cichoracearum]
MLLIDLGFLIFKDFIKSSFTSNAVYALLPILVNDMVRESERFISLGGQLVMTRLVNPISIMNRIESNIEKLIPYYGFKVEGVHYKYSDDICIFIHSNKENSRKLTIFKKDILYAEYDYGLNLYIDNKNETLKYFEREIECLPISKVKRHFSKDVIISAFDIEAYSDKQSNGIFIAYAVGYINPNKEVYTYYLSDFENSKDMLKKCLIDMLLSKPQLGTVYVHNLSRFDTFFIDPIILNDCDIIDGKVLSIKVSFKTGKGSFIFRDSILMTQGSLLSLALNFNSSIIKKNFPHNYVTKQRLNYIGIKPDMSYYENISLEEYNSIPDN